jgi:hypothetical protein
MYVHTQGFAGVKLILSRSSVAAGDCGLTHFHESFKVKLC